MVVNQSYQQQQLQPPQQLNHSYLNRSQLVVNQSQRDLVPPTQQQTRLQQLFLNSSHIIKSSRHNNNNIIDDTICSISSSTPFPFQQQLQPFQQQQQQNIQQQQHQITVTNFNQAVLGH